MTLPRSEARPPSLLATLPHSLHPRLPAHSSHFSPSRFPPLPIIPSPLPQLSLSAPAHPPPRSLSTPGFPRHRPFFSPLLAILTPTNIRPVNPEVFTPVEKVRVAFVGWLVGWLLVGCTLPWSLPSSPSPSPSPSPSSPPPSSPPLPSRPPDCIPKLGGASRGSRPLFQTARRRRG